MSVEEFRVPQKEETGTFKKVLENAGPEGLTLSDYILEGMSLDLFAQRKTRPSSLVKERLDPPSSS